MARVSGQRVPIPARPTKFIHRLRAFIRAQNLSVSTEEAYVYWAKRLIKHYGMRHPETMDKEHLSRFLSHLAVNRGVTPGTQKSALNALIFLFKRFLGFEVEHLNIVYASKTRTLPTVLSHEEVLEVIKNAEPPMQLLMQLMYGSGLRLREACSLRVKDVDLVESLATIRNAKGGKDRVTMLPRSLLSDLELQIGKAKQQHDIDLQRGLGIAPHPSLPINYEKRKSFAMQFLFPAKYLSFDESSGMRQRDHVNLRAVQRAVWMAASSAGVNKRISPHTFRHAFATRLLEQGTNIRVIQELLGHSNVSTTELYTHVLLKDQEAVTSPLD